MIKNVSGSVLHEIGFSRIESLKPIKDKLSLNTILNSDTYKSESYKPNRFGELFLNKPDLKDIKIIAEIKKASPSLKDIAPELNAVDVAKEYIENGADALSILTEPLYFKGNLQYIEDVRNQGINTPILMKDFFVDEYQLHLAKHLKADAILIIMAMLEKECAKDFLKLALNLGLTPLVEVHSLEELKDALDIGAKLIGINNRNLKDLSIDLNTTKELSTHIPQDVTFISESGISATEEIKFLNSFGASGFLVGSSLMKTKTPGLALKKLLSGVRA